MKLLHLVLVAGSMTSLSWGGAHFISQKVSQHSGEKCIQIFHDSKKEARGVLKYLQGFSDYTQYVKPIDQYERGDIERCQATIYVGSKDDSHVPRSFTDDYVKTSKNVAWLGYNIWQLGDQFERVFGLRYIGFGSPHSSLGVEILYKGHSYRKRTLARKQVELLTVNPRKFEVLAEIRSDQSREIVPYVVRAKNRFYYADMPAEYLAHTEHAPIFADILAEMVGLPTAGKARSISSNKL